MDSYPLSKVVDLRIKIISLKQGGNESMSSSWECFELLCKSGPDLSLQDHILLQHFYIGLNKESRAYLNTSSHGSFLHLTSSEARTVLDNILASTNDGPFDVDIPWVKQDQASDTQATVLQGPITHSHTKKLQQKVNSILAEINFNISKVSYYLNVLHWLYLGIYVRGVVQLYTEMKQRRRTKWISSDNGWTSKFSSDNQFRQVRTHQFGHVRTFIMIWS
jgi:hypothetical protein